LRGVNKGRKMENKQKVVIVTPEQSKELSLYDAFLLTVPEDWQQFITDKIKENLKLLSDMFDKKKVDYIPSKMEICTAFVVTRWAKTRVVIIGQDSYSTPGLPTGLAFSVSRDLPPKRDRYGTIIAPTKSLEAIFEVYSRTLGYKTPTHGCLDKWALEGVLLINTALSVEPNKPMSLAIPWRKVTDPLIQNISAAKPLIWVLWGTEAQGIKSEIKGNGHVILKGPHPVARDGSFKTIDHFREINKILTDKGEKPIDWEIV
jgi:uracil-DNA glycosylase